MKIYTSDGWGAKRDNIKALDVGCMITASPSVSMREWFSEVDCALDNGAFSCWRRGYPFQGDVFVKTIRRAYGAGVRLKFIVCPDIVAGGCGSLRFSLKWAVSEYLESAQNLYLPVQDGMTMRHIDAGIRGRFKGLFVGGTKEWKWKTAKDWCVFAHDNAMQCHIGRCGTMGGLLRAHEIGADSVDSSNFARHNSWDVIEEFQRHVNGEQICLC